MTVPPPYSPSGMTPSNDPYSRGWSSTLIASRFVEGSSEGPFGDRPGKQHPVPFEAEVVVQVGGAVLLDDESEGAAGRLASFRAARLWRCIEVPLAVVLFQRHWH